MTRPTSLKVSSVDRKGGWLLIFFFFFFFLGDRLAFHTRPVRDGQNLPNGDVLPATPNRLVLFMIASPGPERDTCNHLHCCQHRHPGPDHGKGPARPSCGGLSRVPRMGPR